MQPGEIAILVERVSGLCRLGKPDPTSYTITFSFTPWPYVLEKLDEGLEALGVYDSKTGRIEIYAERCRQFAEMFGWSVEAVMDVVLIHEVSHMVHHLARDKDLQGRIGECFGKNSCTGEDIENIAQKTTLATIRKHYLSLEPVFKEMSERCQPPEYNSWGDFAELWDKSIPDAEDRLANDVQALRAVDPTCMLGSEFSE